MANRLNYLNPNTTNNHEQQIYRLRSRVVGKQANEKMLGCCKNSWPPEKNINKSKLSRVSRRLMQNTMDEI
jgi:hypothetical protein